MRVCVYIYISTHETYGVFYFFVFFLSSEKDYLGRNAFPGEYIHGKGGVCRYSVFFAMILVCLIAKNGGERTAENTRCGKAI